MSATDELRRLLDERGVEWKNMIRWSDTTWIVCGLWLGVKIEPWRYEDSLKLTLYDVTPAQAVEIALGREKCKTVLMDCFGNPPYNMSGMSGDGIAVGCSECGAPWSTCGLFRGNALKHNFKACPICGREIEQ